MSTPPEKPFPIAIAEHVRNANVAAPCPFLDEKQLCAELSISPVTATKWRARGEGPPYLKVGRLVRYRRADLDEWLAARTIGKVA